MLLKLFRINLCFKFYQWDFGFKWFESLSHIVKIFFYAGISSCNFSKFKGLRAENKIFSPTETKMLTISAKVKIMLQWGWSSFIITYTSQSFDLLPTSVSHFHIFYYRNFSQIFFPQAPSHHSFIFNSRFLYELNHKFRLSKSVHGIFDFLFCFYVFVQRKTWTLWLCNVMVSSWSK